MSQSKTLRVEWNGEPIEVSTSDSTITEIAPGHFAVSANSEQLEVFVLPDGRLSDGQSLDGISIKMESERERIIRERFQTSARSGTVQTGGHVVKAPMPGLVRAIKVSAGDLVERTSTLLVLEAMKMENNILAGANGRIERVLVEEGSSVEKNARLVEIVLE